MKQTVSGSPRTVSEKWVVEEVFPWGSKRLTLRQLQQLASGLDLPTAAARSDLEVMVSGNLTDMFHDPKCVQVIVSITDQGEKLSLRDMHCKN